MDLTDHEYMCPGVIDYENVKFKYVITDSVTLLTNIKTGDTVWVAREMVEECIIHDDHNNTKDGYFSERLLKARWQNDAAIFYSRSEIIIFVER